MQNFFYDDEYYDELETLLEQQDIDETSVNDLSEDFAFTCYESKCEPIVRLGAYWILERMDDERFPEDSDSVEERIKKVLESNIDFTKVNALMPKMYYPTKVKFNITKEDIIEYLK